jgi:hypothetical protein
MAWAVAMRIHHEWLWPVSGTSTLGGEIIELLSSRIYGDIAGEIQTLDGTNADLSIDGTIIRLGTEISPITFDDILQYAEYVPVN